MFVKEVRRSAPGTVVFRRERDVQPFARFFLPVMPAYMAACQLVLHRLLVGKP